MKHLSIIVLVLLGLALVGCDSGGWSAFEDMNNNATVIEQVDVYSSLAMSQAIGTLDVDEGVTVKRKAEVEGMKSLCMVEGSVLEGWVDCSALRIEE